MTDQTAALTQTIAVLTGALGAAGITYAVIQLRDDITDIWRGIFRRCEEE